MKKIFAALVLMLFAVSAAAASKTRMESAGNTEIFLANREIVCTIYFATNSSKLTSEARLAIAQNVKRIKNLDLSEKIVRVEGFASPEGGREKNFRLSIERARAVERFLHRKHGVSLGNYITGYGPVATDGITVAGKKAVQIVVYDNPWGEPGISSNITGGN